MTPKEKAEELFKSMYNVDDIKTYYAICKYKAKQCALIAVDEILNIDYFDMTENYFNDHIEYWQQVKEELNKL